MKQSRKDNEEDVCINSKADTVNKNEIVGNVVKHDYGNFGNCNEILIIILCNFSVTTYQIIQANMLYLKIKISLTMKQTCQTIFQKYEDLENYVR